VSFFPGNSSSMRSSSTKSKKPCKYGPRDADGYCPKKPKAAKKATKKKPCKYGPRDSDGYCPKKKTAFYTGEDGEIKVSKAVKSKAKKETKAITKTISEETLKLLIPAALDKSKREGAKTAVKVLAKTPVKNLLVTGGKGAKVILGGVALAGIAAYWLTTKIITYYPKKIAEQQRAAGEAADAYYQARKDAVARQGGTPLTAAQLKVLSDAFKAKLNQIGITWPLKNTGQ